MIIINNVLNKKIYNKMAAKLNKLALVKSIFKPCINGISEWKTREELSTTDLALTNNGNSRYGVMYGVNNYIWDIKRKSNRPTSKIIALRTNGINGNTMKQSRPIGKAIREHFKYASCANCGLESKGKEKQFVIDHKNDLYNDPRVLSTKTQLITDFQKLCNHCNIIKREICKKTRETGKRIGATKIANVAVFGIDFIKGDETINFKDINAMVGTYWYDPIEFRKKALEKKIKNELAELEITNQIKTLSLSSP
jgi:hypothetical protein